MKKTSYLNMWPTNVFLWSFLGPWPPLSLPPVEVLELPLGPELAAQFAMALTNHSSLSSDEMRSHETIDTNVNCGLYTPAAHSGHPSVSRPFPTSWLSSFFNRNDQQTRLNRVLIYPWQSNSADFSSTDKCDIPGQNREYCDKVVVFSSPSVTRSATA